MTYENDRRAGKTHPDRREVRYRGDKGFCERLGPGYMVRADQRYVANRADRRSYPRPVRRLRVRTLRQLGLGPYANLDN